MIKIVLLTALITLITSADPKNPTWSPRFQQEFIESYTESSFRSVGYYWYDSERNFSRVDRNNGRYDPICGSTGGGSTACVQLVRDGKRYIIYPLIRLCCFCCDA